MDTIREAMHSVFLYHAIKVNSAAFCFVIKRHVILRVFSFHDVIVQWQEINYYVLVQGVN